MNKLTINMPSAPRKVLLGDLAPNHAFRFASGDERDNSTRIVIENWARLEKQFAVAYLNITHDKIRIDWSVSTDVVYDLGLCTFSID